MDEKEPVRLSVEPTEPMPRQITPEQRAEFRGQLDDQLQPDIDPAAAFVDRPPRTSVGRREQPGPLAAEDLQSLSGRAAPLLTGRGQLRLRPLSPSAPHDGRLVRAGATHSETWVRR